MAGGGIRNDKGGGNFLTGDLIEKTEVKMESSYLIKVFCGNILVTGKEGSLGNKGGKERVVEFVYILGETIVYPNFGYLLYDLMVIMSKAPTDELIR